MAWAILAVGILFAVCWYVMTTRLSAMLGRYDLFQQYTIHHPLFGMTVDRRDPELPIALRHQYDALHRTWGRAFYLALLALIVMCVVLLLGKAFGA